MQEDRLLGAEQPVRPEDGARHRGVGGRDEVREHPVGVLARELDHGAAQRRQHARDAGQLGIRVVRGRIQLGEVGAHVRDRLAVDVPAGIDLLAVADAEPEQEAPGKGFEQ